MYNAEHIRVTVVEPIVEGVLECLGELDRVYSYTHTPSIDKIIRLSTRPQ